MLYYTLIQLCVRAQLPTSVDNVALPAFAAERRAAVRADRYHLPAGPTAANPPPAATSSDRWTGQTDGQTDGHRTVTQTLPHTMRAV